MTRWMTAGIGLVSLGLGASTAEAGAWTKELGDTYSKVGVDVYKSLAYVDPTTGKKVEGLEFLGQQTSIYSEVGVLPMWPLQVSLQVPVAYGVTTFEDEVTFPAGELGRATSLRMGDLRLQVQTAVWRKGLQISTALELKVPLYSNDTVGQDFGIWQMAFPLPGDGQVDLTGWVWFGGSIPGVPMFAQGAVGFRVRTDAFVGWDTNLRFVNGLPFTGTLGLTTGPLLTMLQVDGIKNFKEDQVTREQLYLGGAVMWTVWRGLALEARGGAEVWADNVGGGVSWRTPSPNQ